MHRSAGRRGFGLVRATLPSALALALAALPAPALQDPASAGPAAGIEPGSAVRIRTMDRGTYSGRLLRGDPGSLSIGVRGRTETLPTSEVDALWKGGRAIGTGAWVGALAGGVPSVLFAALLCNAFSENTGCDEWDKVAVFGLIGGGVGAGAGALIGAFVRTWDLRWSRASLAPASGLVGGRPFVGVTLRF